MKTQEKIHRGSGNVFADIGLPQPEEVSARADIMIKITDIIESRGLTQKEAAKILDIPQSKVSCLMNGKLNLFSLEYLMKFLNALGNDVKIIVEPKLAEKKKATTQVFTDISCLRERSSWKLLKTLLSRNRNSVQIESVGGFWVTSSSSKYNDIQPLISKTSDKLVFGVL